MLQSLMTSTDESVLNPTIVEPWLRQYQVLPGRTHPEMNGTPHGGYLLHGIKVIDATAGVKAISAGKGDRGRGSNKRRKK
jgi:tRNA (adenine-N(1)-)-methyltransferase non-catalytic subunit